MRGGVLPLTKQLKKPHFACCMLVSGLIGTLSQQVLRIETESAASVAFCFHPFKPLLTMVDARGVVRVVNYRPMSGDAKHAVDARAITNRFHVARGLFVLPVAVRSACAQI